MSNGRRLRLNPAIAAGLCLALTGCLTHSGQRGVWLNSEQANAENAEMVARSMMPVAIDCRLYAPTSPPKYATRIEWAPNTQGARWRWDVGDADYMRRSEAQAARNNLRVVQYKVGTDANCAIWRG
jgi:hypothetical protein